MKVIKNIIQAEQEKEIIRKFYFSGATRGEIFTNIPLSVMEKQYISYNEICKCPYCGIRNKINKDWNMKIFPSGAGCELRLLAECKECGSIFSSSPIFSMKTYSFNWIVFFHLLIFIVWAINKWIYTVNENILALSILFLLGAILCCWWTTFMTDSDEYKCWFGNHKFKEPFITDDMIESIWLKLDADMGSYSQRLKVLNNRAECYNGIVFDKNETTEFEEKLSIINLLENMGLSDGKDFSRAMDLDQLKVFYESAIADKWSSSQSK